jgi:uncharacterized membrane protein
MGGPAMSGSAFGVTLACAVACGLNGGVFFGFSAFIMRGLDALPAAQGIAAMQSINRLAVTPLFMLVLFGTAVACLGLAVWSVVSWGEPGAAWVLAGCMLYLVGAIVVTIAFNVPLNDRLAAVDANSAGGADEWRHYVTTWTAWNHVRTVAPLLAAGLLTLALTAD